MNNLIGTVVEVVTEGALSLVAVDAGDLRFNAIVVATTSTADYLKIGGTVNIMIKENEVAIAKNWQGEISMQNRLRCTITAIELGKILACITLLLSNNLSILSVITAKSAVQMALYIGDEVTAFIKANEISFSL
jgi:molybdate transport system regulatory protein